MRFIFFISVFGSTVLFSCGGNETKEKPLKGFDSIPPTGDAGPVDHSDTLEPGKIVVVRDPALVKKIRANMQAVQQARIQEEKENRYAWDAPQRLNAGDTSAFEEVMSMLKSEHFDERKKVYDHLYFFDLGRRKNTPQEKQICAAITKNISLPDDEEEVISWLNYASPRGYFRILNSGFSRVNQIAPGSCCSD